jgi:hypothetical protein
MIMKGTTMEARVVGAPFWKIDRILELPEECCALIAADAPAAK